MRTYLLFRVYAPLAAWGDIAVGEVRPSYSHPTRSALVGLLAAACGVERADEARQTQMAAAYHVAVRVDMPGHFLRDYHTVQPPHAEKSARWYTRRDEILAVRRQQANAIVSSRDYYMDALYVICVWVADGVNPPFALRHLAGRLGAPVFTLYAGRKCCPLAAPVQAQLVEAESIKTAFAAARFHEDYVPRAMAAPAFFYDDCDHAGFDNHMLQRVTRRDVPSSRKRWQFSERQELHACPPATATQEPS
jgi:CRISPR system Cascade subunit CasD